jgi:hypothetical protein
MAKSIKVDKDGMVMLSAFYDWLDISKVKFYNVKFNKDGTITIKFYNSKKKLVKPYAQ